MLQPLKEKSYIIFKRDPAASSSAHKVAQWSTFLSVIATEAKDYLGVQGLGFWAPLDSLEYRASGAGFWGTSALI